MFYSIITCFLTLFPLTLNAGETITVRPLTTANGLTDNHTIDAFLLADGRVAVTTWGNINIYNGSQFTHVRLLPSYIYSVLLKGSQHRFGIDRNGRLWQKRLNNLTCLDIHHGDFVKNIDSLFHASMPESKGSTKVLDVFIDHNHDLWLYTKGEIYNTTTQRYYSLGNSKSDVCYIDANMKNVWAYMSDGQCIAISLSGDRQLSAFPILPSSADASEYWGAVARTASDDNVYILYTGHKSSLYRFNPNTHIATHLHTAQRLVRSFGIAPDGNLWLCHRAGIDIFANDGTLLRSINHFRMDNGAVAANNDVSSVTFDQNNGVWIAMTEGGIFYHHACKYAFQSASTLAELGLPQWIDETFHERRSPQYSDAANHSDNDDLLDSRGMKWRATNHGLYLSVPGQPDIIIDYKDGMPSDYFMSLAEDHDGNIWAATSNGIVCLKVTTNTEGKPRISTAIFGHSDGILRGEYLPRNAACLADGRIVMAGVEGWTVFSPQKVIKPSLPLSPKIVSIMVNGKVVHANNHNEGITLDKEAPFARELTVNYDHNNISFDVSSFFYSHPEHTAFRWRLVSGRDTTWQYDSYYTSSIVTEDGVLHLSMMKLPAGEYHLEVEASSDGIHYDGERAIFTLLVLPPWWATWWAYSIYTFIALTIIIVSVWLYMRDQRRTLEWKRQEEVLQLKIRNLMEKAVIQVSVLAPPVSFGTEEETESDDEVGESEETIVSVDEEEKVNSEDTPFIRQVVNLIDKHIGDTYTVEQLAADLCMERTGLYKKLTSLIDQSPQVFIRTIRLRHAAEMLENTDKSITDIAYQTGFSSVAYFVRCFRTQYGVTPGDWRKSKLAKQ